MPDSLPVSNVEFDPHRFSSDRPKSNTPQEKKKKKNQRTDQQSKDDKDTESKHSSNEPGVGGQLDLEV